MGYSQPRRVEEHIAHEVWLALLLLGVVLVQSTLLPRPLGSMINPLLLLVVCQSLLVGPAKVARWGLYGGLSLDVCAGSSLGTHALALIAAALLASVVQPHLSRDNWLLPLTGVALGALAYYAVLALIWSLLVAPIDLRMYLLVVVLPNVLLALTPSLPLFLFMRWVLGRRRGEVPIDVY